MEVPQVRDGVAFYPSALERGVRSQRALKLAIAEMYVQGVSTRKVTAVAQAPFERSALCVPRRALREGSARRSTVFAFPTAHRRRLRTSNIMERTSKEIKRRTKVAPCSQTRPLYCA